jgi:excisionase family DNA binding protein
MQNSILIENTTTEEFWQHQRQIIREEMANFQPKPQKQLSDPYRTRKETATKIHVSLPTLNELTKSGKLKAYRIGGRVLYKESEIEASLISIQAAKYRRA